MSTVGVGVQDLGSHIGDMTEIELDFGAEQVILVRDDIVKKRVQSEIGETALVLTILESKGMEFDDVFLIDFFTSSPCASSLRKLGDILTSGGCSVEGTKSGVTNNAHASSENVLIALDTFFRTEGI
jgi:hypothetical protein